VVNHLTTKPDPVDLGSEVNGHPLDVVVSEGITLGRIEFDGAPAVANDLVYEIGVDLHLLNKYLVS